MIIFYLNFISFVLVDVMFMLYNPFENVFIFDSK